MIINTMPEGSRDVMISKVMGDWLRNSNYGSHAMYFKFKVGSEFQSLELSNPDSRAEFIINPPISILDILSEMSIECASQYDYNELSGASISISPNTSVLGTYILSLAVINPRDPR